VKTSLFYQVKLAAPIAIVGMSPCQCTRVCQGLLSRMELF
jgi:hypothetical protein